MPTDTNDLAIVYTTPEEGDVYAQDDRYVDLTGATARYLIHLFKKTNDNREDNIRVRAVVKSTYAPTSKPVYLQIWNGTSLIWETIATISDKAANVDFSMDAFVPTNDSSYYDFGNQIAVRVYQQNDSGSGKTLSINQILISFEAQYNNVFDVTDSKYDEVFPPVESEYEPVYPHKNPQDDL